MKRSTFASHVAACASAPLAAAMTGWTASGRAAAADHDATFRDIERSTGGRLGVAALDLQTGRRIGYRAGERFPLASTMKLPLVVMTLRRVERGRERLDRRIAIPASQRVAYSPFVDALPRNAHPTVADLCAAAIEQSDNTAARVLLAAAGGPAALTREMHGLGISAFRLDRTEPDLNEARPGDPRDTVTPSAMLRFVGGVWHGDYLRARETARVLAWMGADKVGGARFRAGVPGGWAVADKTGTTHVGANDVGLLLRPGNRAPVALAAYITDATAPSAARERALARVAALAARTFR